jgi:hypothetical protein
MEEQDKDEREEDEEEEEDDFMVVRSRTDGKRQKLDPGGLNKAAKKAKTKEREDAAVRSPQPPSSV